MDIQKYNLNDHPIEIILAWVKGGEIAIPEIQRPFVWNSSKVRDLIDSLYQGFPIGYVITWKNPNTKLKDGSSSRGKKILIDGQQRVTALTAAILGEYVINKDYQRVRIKIAFNPIEEKFEVQTPVIVKDKQWIPDISEVLSGQYTSYNFIKTYIANNNEEDEEKIVDSIERLFNLTKKQIGLIDLSGELDIETVTEIFIRINSKGVVLSQADFAMSKIASNDTYDGQTLRKAIDYFCHLAIMPEFYQFIADNDKDFSSTDYFQKMTWLKNENDDLYDPSYTDMLRVAFTTEFNRGRMSDLVSLLSGRNFETRTFEEEIAEESFRKLKVGIFNFMNETNFKRFVMIIKSAGFVDVKMIRSQNALNFAYIVYLKLRSKGIDSGLIEIYVRKWYVFSILTERYSSSPESTFDFDIKQIENKTFDQYLQEKEDGELSEAFWDVNLVQRLDTSVASSPFFNVFLASQVKDNDRGFLSKEISVNNLIIHRGDIHHIFPKNYLKKAGLTRSRYNQIANYVYMQQEVNIKVGNKAPEVYFSEVLEQCHTGELKYGAIANKEELSKNLEENCIPESVFTMTLENYQDFLNERRKLMAKKIKEYYYSL
jgi:hypothetical protein